MTKTTYRGFSGGGPKKPAISNKETEFDIIFVGGINAAALTKFVQQHPDGDKLKMAVISREMKYVHPQAYFGVSQGALPALRLLSGTPSAQIENWSKIDTDKVVTKISPEANKLTLDSGVEYSYKALVLAPGFDHDSKHITGLSEMESED